MLLTLSLIAHFWSKVIRSPDPDGCWLWRDACDNWGYGHFYIGGRSNQAHRVMYDLVYGPIPEGRVICHRCDVPNCVRPSHLFAGTQRDNIQDAKRKGRVPHGERHWQARLTETDVKRIRSLVESGQSQREVAAQFGIGHVEVSRIVHRRRWAHI